MYQLRLFGGASLEGPAGPVTGRAGQRRPLALLALLAASEGATVSRDKLVACLWPESASKRARHRLSVTLHALRKALGAEAVVSVADDLRLNTDLVSADVVEFREALEADGWERAVELYAGPFLDGFHVREAPGFERWVDAQRMEHARGYRRALEELAEGAEERGAWSDAVRWWKKRAAAEPTSSRVAIRLMRALEASGDRPAALRHARVHALLVREELGVEPDPEVAALAERLENGEVEREGPSDAASGGSASASPSTGSAFEGAGERADVSEVDAPPSGLAAEERRAPGERERSRDTPDAGGGWELRSPSGIAAASAGVIVLVAGSLTMLAPAGDEPVYDSRRVLVDLFESQTENPSMEEIGRMAADWITQGLTYTGFVDVVTLGTPLLAKEPEVDPASVADRQTRLAQIARAHGTGTLVWGSCYRQGDTVYIQAHVTDIRDHRELASLEPVAAPVDAPVPALEELRDRVMTALATRTDPRLAKWQRNASKPPTFEAYQKFVEGIELHTTHGRFREAADRFREAADLDPDFTIAKLWAVMSLGTYTLDRWEVARPILRELSERRERLAPLDRAFLDYQLARERAHTGDGDAMGMLRAARRMVEIAPGSEYLKLAGHAALQANRPAEAVRHYERADPESGWLRGWTPYWKRLATAHHRLGNHERELEVARRGRALYPEDLSIRQKEMGALAALGRIEELEVAVTDIGEVDSDYEGWALASAAKELVAHDHGQRGRAFFRRAIEWRRRRLAESEEADETRSHRLALVRLLRAVGDLAGADEQLDELMAEHPRHVYVLREGALLRAKQGRREAAMELLRRLEELDAPRHIFPEPEVAALLGERERAMRLLQEYEKELGLHYPYLLHAPTLWSLRDYPPFQELVRPRG